MNMDDYREWAAQQRCCDCGKPREPGEMWVTEIQCVPCWQKLGAPEKRGLPGAAELFREWKPEYHYDSEAEERDGEVADMIVGWAAVILVLCWIAAIAWGWV